MDLEQLNILGNDIVLIGSAFLAEAAIKEAESNNIKNNELQDEIEAVATKFNIWGNWLTFIGDYMLAIAASLVAQKSQEESNNVSESNNQNNSNKGEQKDDTKDNDIQNSITKAEALELDLIGSWGSVIADYFAVLAAELEASTK